jgi:hypothetical protein
MADNQVARGQPSKRKIKAVVVQHGHRTANLSVYIDSETENDTDLHAFENALRKKNKTVSERMNLAQEFMFERQNDELQWEMIGDDSPLKSGDTVQVVICQDTTSVSMTSKSQMTSITEILPNANNQRRVLFFEGKEGGNCILLLCFVVS